MSFKLYSNLFESFDEMAEGAGEAPSSNAVSVDADIRHQVIVIDRNLFRFRDELLLVVEPLKFCLLLAVHLYRFGDPKAELPIVSVMIYEGKTEGFQTSLLPITLSHANLHEILASVGRLLDKDAGNLQASDAGLISFDEFSESLESAVDSSVKENSQVTCFFRQRTIDFSERTENAHHRFVRFFSVQLLVGHKPREDELFGIATRKIHQDDESGYVVETKLPAVKFAVDDFFKQFIFERHLTSSTQKVDIVLPQAVFSKGPICISCDVAPRTCQTSIFPELSLVERGPSLVPNRGQPHSKIFRVRLESVDMIRTSGICQTLLFGHQTYVLYPAAMGSTLGFASNKDRFRGLSQFLARENVSLSVKGRLKEVDDDAVSPHFIVMTSQSGHLILKSIATGDLLLPLPPDDTRTSGSAPSLEMLDVQTAFENIRLRDEFDPLDYECNLAGHLEDLIKKGRSRPAAATASSRGGKRSKYSPVVH